VYYCSGVFNSNCFNACVAFVAVTYQSCSYSVFDSYEIFTSSTKNNNYIACFLHTTYELLKTLFTYYDTTSRKSPFTIIHLLYETIAVAIALQARDQRETEN
ncbi:MAG: hypothetical protein ACI90V_009929, partial [Bacillariaceae sp.]|jgi:hypothetical protein